MKIVKSRILDVLKAIGFTPYEFQIDILERLFDVPSLGVSIPRQNGKTETELMAATIAGLRGDHVGIFVSNGTLVAKSMKRLEEKLEPWSHAGSRLVNEIKRTVNRNSVDFVSGGSVEFFIRSVSNLTGVGASFDMLIFDEAQAMSTAEFAAIQPTITASPRPCIMMIGTPPTENDLALGETPFVRQRMAGGAGWIEYGIGDYSRDHSPYGVSDFHKANPAWRHISRFTARMRENQVLLGDLEFSQQYLGAWLMPGVHEIHEPEFSITEIKTALTTKPIEARTLRAGLGIYPDSDIAFVTLSDGETYECADRINISMGDMNGIIRFMQENARRFAVMTIPANARGNSVYSMLTKRNFGKKIQLSDSTSTATKIGAWFEAMHNGKLRIYRTEDGIHAVSTAWRKLNDRSRAAEVEADSPEMRAAMLSMVLAYGEDVRAMRSRAVSYTL